MESIDKAIYRMVSKSSGRNESERMGYLETQKTQRPNPTCWGEGNNVRRVWIPKPDGKQRPLGVPAIKDCVAQTAAVLVLEPIMWRCLTASNALRFAR